MLSKPETPSLLLCSLKSLTIVRSMASSPSSSVVWFATGGATGGALCARPVQPPREALAAVDVPGDHHRESDQQWCERVAEVDERSPPGPDIARIREHRVRDGEDAGAGDHTPPRPRHPPRTQPAHDQAERDRRPSQDDDVQDGI